MAACRNCAPKRATACGPAPCWPCWTRARWRCRPIRRGRRWTRSNRRCCACATARVPRKSPGAQARRRAGRRGACPAGPARLRGIAANTGRGVSAQDMDRARSAAQVAQAQADEQREALRPEAGPRKEDIAGAEAQLQATQAQLALLRHQISQGELKAPADAVVRSRLLEPGDMATPQRPVTRWRWRSAGSHLRGRGRPGKVKPGMAARVQTDSQPDKPIAGKVGYISSVAEFTPKAVQTEELRTSRSRCACGSTTRKMRCAWGSRPRCGPRTPRNERGQRHGGRRAPAQDLRSARRRPAACGRRRVAAHKAGRADRAGRRTAPARPRCCACWPGCSGRTTARCGCWTST